MKNNYEIRGDVTYVFIESKKHGMHEFLIDTSCLHNVKGMVSWFIVVGRNDLKYVSGMSESGEQIILHRFLTNAPTGKIVDHINGNTLDNRLNNLRIVTNAENCQNRRGAQRNSKSSIRGVSWHKATGKWRANFRLNGVSYHLGLYDNIEEAARVVQEARRKNMPFSQADIVS